MINFIFEILEKCYPCFYLTPVGLWRCGKLWESTLVRYFISQDRPGYAAITNSIFRTHKQQSFIYCSYHMTILVCPGSTPCQDETGWASTSWMSLITMTEGRRALESVALTIKCSGLEVTHITFGHRPLTHHHPINHKGPRSAILPCAQKVETCKYLVNSIND